MTHNRETQKVVRVTHFTPSAHRLNFPRTAPFFSSTSSSSPPTQLAKMENDKGEIVDLYVPLFPPPFFLWFPQGDAEGFGHHA